MCTVNIPLEGKKTLCFLCLTTLGQWKNASLRSIDVNQSPRLTIESRVLVPINLDLYFLTNLLNGFKFRIGRFPPSLLWTRKYQL